MCSDGRGFSSWLLSDVRDDHPSPSAAIAGALLSGVEVELRKLC